MNRSILIIFPILLLLLIVGCSKNDPSVNATRLRISLTDAPLQVKEEGVIVTEMNINIQKIEVSLVDTLDKSEDWVTLDYNGGVYNILTLTNGKSMQIADQYFPTGVLRRVKVTFGDNNTIKANGTTRNLVLDSSAKEGITLVVNANLYANYISNIMIDVNASLSLFEENGNFIFKPNIRAFAETSGGALRGYVLPPESNPRVIIANEVDTLFTFPELKDGLFMFKGLQVGEWDIYVFADPLSGYADTIFTDTIYLGKTTDIKSKIVLKKITQGGGEEEEGDKNGDESK